MVADKKKKKRVFRWFTGEMMAEVRCSSISYREQQKTLEVNQEVSFMVVFSVQFQSSGRVSSSLEDMAHSISLL